MKTQTTPVVRGISNAGILSTGWRKLLCKAKIWKYSNREDRDTPMKY